MSTSPLRVGDVLYGFCGGHFGRDSYADKTVAAIGFNWVVVIEEGGTPQLHHGSPEDLCEYREESS